MIVEQLPEAVRSHVREAKRQGRIVGCVPTMGALHDGHCSLIEQARRDCDFVVGTIFVNPTQFGPGEDFSRYPRTLEADLDRCRTAGADLVFTPAASVMYQKDADTVVVPGQLATVLEGAIRPGHFSGVTTVVTKLFGITEPDVAFFGQKDFQQQLIIRRMVRDLNLAVRIVTCPIIRESDGLAMSSRNRYLTETERAVAGDIHQALREAIRLADCGECSAAEVALQMRRRLERSGQLQVQYAVVANPETLEEYQTEERGIEAVALIAVQLGSTRLIDNALLRFG